MVFKTTIFSLIKLSLVTIEGPTQVLNSRKGSNCKCHNLLAKVGLRDYGEAYPNELALAARHSGWRLRALAMSPKYILLDEPTSAPLDPELT